MAKINYKTAERVWDMANKYTKLMHWSLLLGSKDLSILFAIASGRHSPAWCVLCLAMHENEDIKSMAKITLQVMKNIGELQ
jgi:hypothetical protein